MLTTLLFCRGIEDFANFSPLWWGKCAATCRGKCEDFTSGKARGDWEQVASCFRSIDEIKIAGENEKVCVKIHRSFFFSVHEIDY